MSQHKDNPALSAIEIKMEDGKFFVNGKDCSEYSVQTDAWIEANGLTSVEAFVMLSSYLGHQAAVQQWTSGENDNFYIRLVTTIFGESYEWMMLQLLELANSGNDTKH